MRTRNLFLVAAGAAAGLAALGTVAAQQPRPSAPLPATTVRPYDQWSPTPSQPGAAPVQPAGGYLQPPPGYQPRQPVTGGARPAGGPVMAGPDGVRPASAFDLPPPSLDTPPAKAGPGLPPPSMPTLPPPGGARPLPPPALPADPGASKFSAPPLYPDTKSETPAVPVPPPVSGPSTPAPAAPPVVKPSAPPVVPAPTFTPAPVEKPVEKPVVEKPAPAAEKPVAEKPTVEKPAAPAAPTTTGPAALPTRVAPSVVVESVSEPTVAFGQEFKYDLIVRNTGSVTVGHVRVEDEIPAGARYVGSDPPAEQNGDRLVWAFGSLDAGAEKRISVRVKPADEGEVRSRAVVMFAASVDARAKVTRPRVAVVVTGSEVCRAGEETEFKIKLTNSGTGPATRMIVQARLADGLLHQQGLVIEAELANLQPGQTKELPLKVNAAKAGLQWCQVVVAADGSPDATAKASVNVVEPMLQVRQGGPAKCLVRAEPTYTIELANPGTAATDPVLLQSVLPDGFEYVQASDGGSYSPDNRSVTWRLPTLAAGSTRSVTLKLRAVSAAEGMLRTVATAGPQSTGVIGASGPGTRPGRGLESKAETQVSAEGIAAVRFEVVGLDNPVEVGKEAVYEIRVTNSGTGPCTNVQLVAALSDGTQFVTATQGTNPAKVSAQGQQLVFDPIPTLGVKGDAVYRVRVRGMAPGDLRFRVQLTCDQLKTPVVKEESTQFVKQ